MSVREEPLENVIQEIRRQTGYAFFFDAAYLRQAHPVTLELTAVPVEDALEQLFKQQPFNFSIDNRIITIKPRPDGAIRRVQKSVQGIVTDSTGVPLTGVTVMRSEEHTSELQSLMRTSYA